MAEDNELKWISGFWRRIGAFFIDSIILGLVGFGLGLFLEDIFVEIGGWGRLVGFSIALIYFGIMNSRIANGQTFGKKMLKLRVVSADNKPISLVKSFGRYSIIGIPFFLNGVQLPIETTISFWLYGLSLIIFGGLFSIVYLYVFNRVTRQSLHDLVFSTFVVNVGIDNANIEKIWRPHLITVGLFFLAAALVPVYTSSLAQQEPFSDLIKAHGILLENPLVNNASITYGKSIVNTVKTGTTETTYVKAQIFLKKNQISNSELSHKIASALVKHYKQAIEKDVILINLIYGYDIGISSRWSTYSHRFNPSDMGVLDNDVAF